MILLMSMVSHSFNIQIVHGQITDKGHVVIHDGHEGKPTRLADDDGEIAQVKAELLTVLEKHPLVSLYSSVVLVTLVLILLIVYLYKK